MAADAPIPAKHHVPWITILLFAAAIGVFFFSVPGQLRFATTTFGVASQQPIMPKGVQIDASAPALAPAPSMMEADASYGGSVTANAVRIAPSPGYPVPYGGSTPISDTREFIKTTYNATMQTRNVQELTKRAETTIRGYGGRIDSTSSSHEYGYVNFVLPADKFEAFRQEIEKFVPEKFLKVNISGYNMLPQKQGIEAAQKNVESNIDDLKAKRAKIVADHSAAVRSLSSRIDDAETEINAIHSLPPTNDSYELNRRATRENQLSTSLTSLYSQLSNENTNYKYSIDSIDSQISYAGKNLEGVQEQDQNLLNDVATVNGSITFNWISLWEMIQLYVPAKVIAGVLALLAALAYLWERRSSKIA